MNYKGQLMEKGVEFVLALVFIGIFLGAGLIALSSFATGQTGATLAGINNATYGLTQFSLQLGTVGTIAAVGLIILVLVGVMAVAYVFVGHK